MDSSLVKHYLSSMQEKISKEGVMNSEGVLCGQGDMYLSWESYSKNETAGESYKHDMEEIMAHAFKSLRKRLVPIAITYHIYIYTHTLPAP
jgi:hypothetical protein